MNGHHDVSRPLGMLVKTWPKLSETFILEEVLGLERQGVKLAMYALEAPSDDVRHGAVDRVRAPVSHVPPARLRHAPAFLLRHLQLLVSEPLAWGRTLSAALRRGRSGRIDFLRAGWLAVQMQRDGVAHLHSHFISAPADIAELAAALACQPFSISAHAKDIYTSKPQDLKRKMMGAQFTVSCTEFNVQTLREIAPQAVVQRMYHGIDHQVFHPLRREPSPGELPLLLAVGRLRAKKGLDTLIEACALLQQRGVPFRCEIVGYGEERDRLEAHIVQRGLVGRIVLPGKLTREQVIARYARTAVFVQPSRITADGDRDGIPNVLLEALAMALPVVATRVSGIPEVVRHQHNGLLVEPDDPAALADQIAWLLVHREEAAMFGRVGRATVIDAFDNDRNLQVLTRLLEHSHEHCTHCAAA